MRLQTCLKIGGAIVVTSFLAACGSSSPVINNPPTGGSLESKFGSEFATIFDASSTAQPASVDNNSVPPVQPADQPIAVP
jgi:hypothetical protein